ncbi:MAG: YadA-like family protein [Veillonella sp.]|nr:YadA-like family protein [Veillonella sp.]
MLNLKGINTIKNGNTTITLNDTPSTTTPAVTITGGNLSLGDGTTNNKIVNVAPGTDDTDAVNVKQLKDAKTVLADGKNTKKSGTGTAADPYKVNVEGDLTEITSITNKADASGNNAGKITFSPNQTVTVSGDHNISLNGKTGDITGLTNTTIPTTAGSDFATKGRAATEEQLKIVNDKFNNKINLGADGSTETTKLALDNNGGIKFNIKGDGSGASGANQYISTTASGSDIKVDLTDDAKAKLNKSYNVTSNDNSVQVKSTTTNGVTTFDLKVAPAAGTTSTWDIKSSADTANGGATATGHETAAKTIANTNSVEMIAGKNLTVKQTSDTNGAKVEFALSDEITVGKDGTNGVDGKIGVNGKDGASVVINGKDGSIGLTGAPGTPGTPGASATLKVKDGVPGVDGAPGTNLTRIVYTDKNNVEHEVATHDDGMKFAGDDGQANQATNANVIKKHLNNVVDIIGGATKTDLTTNNIGVNNDGNGKLLVQLSKNLNGINTVKNGNTTITLNDAPGGATNTPAVTISGGNLSMGDGTHNNKIVNVAPGTADTDAVNVKQLKDTELHITPGTYTPDTNKKVKLTYTDGNGTVVSGKEAVIDLSGLSTGGATASTWNVKSSANTTDGGAVGATHDATAQNIANGKTVEFQSGKNLVVTQTNDTTNGNATVEFSLSDNITVGKDGANGKDGSVGAKGADGSAVVMNGKDGSIGLNGTNGANGISIKGKDGANGVGIDGKDGVTRIVYTEKVPDPANPGTTKEVTHEVATMDDGLKFTGNNTATENKHKLGSLVKVQGEGVTAADEAAFQSASGNIAVTADGTDTLTIRLNKNLKGLNSIQLGDNTIKSNGDNIEFTTKGGTTKTVATTDQLWTIQANGTDVPATNGKVNVVGKDGITVAKNAAGNLEISGTGLGTMNGFDVTANNGATSKTITDGKKVDFNAGSNLTVKQTSDANGTHIEYALKEAVDLGTNGSLKAGDTTVNKDGVTIANGPSITKTGVDAGDKKITNVADGAVNATSKDAVNGSQLKKYTDAAKTTVEAGDTNVKVETDNSAADGHTNYKVSLEPVVTIGDTHKVKIDGHTGDITGLTNVNLTDPTFATKGRAATEEQLKQVLTEAKNKAIEKVQAGTAAAGDTNIATVAPKAGDTFGAAGATYEVSVSKNAVKDAAKEAVKVTSASPAITVTADTSVAHETTYKVGFDGNQAATQIPLTYKQNGGNTRTVKLSDGLNFIDGTNTKARTAADGKVTFDVMGDLTGITSISNAAGGPKMTFGGNSINVTNGDLNMGDNKITNVKKGTATTDAATVGQLTKVTSNNHSVVINKTTDANGAPVYDLAVTGTPGAPAADPRVDMLGEEIGRVGAQGAALSALKPIQYDPLEPTQIMAGYGNYRGNSAVALGVAHYKNESTLIHGGVSWAGGSSHMMANAGVTWKVGNRDSEAAVADRYRKGPISSAYAMQQEMAAMKAQNAGLKGEVSDLKAENEQMKAQIAAMMAKLGL